MLQKLPNDNACREHLEQIHWNGTPICAFCFSDKSYKLTTKGVFSGLYKCGNCKMRYNVATSTMFEGSHIGYQKWFIAMYIMQSHKKGISSYQLARDLGISQKASWFMLHRIRNAMKERGGEKLEGRIELDETFVGGKNKNRHSDKKVEKSQGRSFKDKVPVLGILREAEKETIYRPHKKNPLLTVKEIIYKTQAFVRCVVVRDTKAQTLQPFVYCNVKEGSTIISDEWYAYRGLERHYDHKVVDHKAKNYVTSEGDTSNALEGFWTWFKKTWSATYHKMSRKHLQAYANEIAFRYNFHRMKEVDRFSMLLGMTGCRLSYKMLVGRT